MILGPNISERCENSSDCSIEAVDTAPGGTNSTDEDEVEDEREEGEIAVGDVGDPERGELLESWW